MLFYVLPCGPLQANCYILSDIDTKNSLVIDPGDSRAVLSFMNEQALTVSKIILTHGHFDHCMGAEELSKITGAEIWMHPDDEELVDGSTYVSASQYDFSPFKCSSYLQEGDTVALDSISLNVLHTPGHSKGSICLVNEENGFVLSGDTLFYESIGRTDLHGGSMRELFHSVFDKLFLLPDSFNVFPGHGDRTTIEHEKKSNPLVQYEDYFRRELI